MPAKASSADVSYSPTAPGAEHVSAAPTAVPSTLASAPPARVSARWLSVARYNWGKELYFRIHHGNEQAFACYLLNRFGALLRLALWLIPTVLTAGLVPRFRQKALLFLRVLTAPLRERRPPPHTEG